MTKNEYDLKRHSDLHAKHLDLLVESVKDPANRAVWKLRWLHLPVIPEVRALMQHLGMSVAASMKSVAVSMTGVDEPWAYSLHAAAGPGEPWGPIPVPYLAKVGGLTADDVIKEEVIDPKVRLALMAEVTYRCGSRNCGRRHAGHCLGVRVSVSDGEVIANVATVGLEGVAEVESVLFSRVEPMNLSL